MKTPLLALSALGFVLVSCDTGSSVRSNYDPLDAAGGFGGGPNLADTGHRPGDFVTARMDNTGFFKSKPEGSATAEKLLSAGTSMKVISDTGSFVKVELDSGEVGYVSTVQVLGADEGGGPVMSDAAVQVWPPPSGDIQPLDDPNLADPDLPVVPTDIDPDAPVDEPALPDDGAGEVAPPPLPEPVPANEEAAGDDAAAAPGE